MAYYSRLSVYLDFVLHLVSTYTLSNCEEVPKGKTGRPTSFGGFHPTSFDAAMKKSLLLHSLGNLLSFASETRLQN